MMEAKINYASFHFDKSCKEKFHLFQENFLRYLHIGFVSTNQIYYCGIIACNFKFKDSWSSHAVNWKIITTKQWNALDGVKGMYALNFPFEVIKFCIPNEVFVKDFAFAG